MADLSGDAKEDMISILASTYIHYKLLSSQEATRFQNTAEIDLSMDIVRFKSTLHQLDAALSPDKVLSTVAVTLAQEISPPQAKHKTYLERMKQLEAKYTNSSSSCDANTAEVEQITTTAPIAKVEIDKTSLCRPWNYCDFHDRLHTFNLQPSHWFAKSSPHLSAIYACRLGWRCTGYNELTCFHCQQVFEDHFNFTTSMTATDATFIEAHAASCPWRKVSNHCPEQFVNIQQVCHLLPTTVSAATAATALGAATVSTMSMNEDQRYHEQVILPDYHLLLSSLQQSQLQQSQIEGVGVEVVLPSDTSSSSSSSSKLISMMLQQQIPAADDNNSSMNSNSIILYPFASAATSPSSASLEDNNKEMITLQSDLHRLCLLLAILGWSTNPVNAPAVEQLSTSAAVITCHCRLCERSFPLSLVPGHNNTTNNKVVIKPVQQHRPYCPYVLPQINDDDADYGADENDQEDKQGEKKKEEMVIVGWEKSILITAAHMMQSNKVHQIDGHGDSIAAGQKHALLPEGEKNGRSAETTDLAQAYKRIRSILYNATSASSSAAAKSTSK